MQASDHAIVNFEEYCFKELFSDCTVIVVEESGQAEGPTCAGLEQEHVSSLSFPAHALLLAASSAYFKSKLQNWNSAGWKCSSCKNRDAKPEVLLPVPAGQLYVGQLLLKTIYQQQPRLEEVSQQQLFQLLILADRYSIPKVVPAVSAAFKAITVDKLHWETALALLDLPDSCTKQKSFTDMVTMAADRLQQQLGDLEAVWNDEKLTDQLLSLSAAALKQLLQHDGTRVASENTVAYTVQSWYDEQEDLTAIAAAQLGLMQLVRMRHCTQLYISTVMADSELFCACFTPAELGIAIACTENGFKKLQAAKCPVLEKYSAWGAEKRPISARPQVIEWQLEISRIKTAVNKALGNGDTLITDVCSDECILQGQPLRLQL